MPFLFNEMLPLGVVAAFRQADFFGQMIVCVLFFGSMFVWSIMLVKFQEVRTAKKNSRLFLHAYRKSHAPMDPALIGQRFPASPFHEVYRAAIRKINTMDKSAPSTNHENLLMDDTQMKAVRTVIENRTADESLNLESYMGFLALATTTAPLLGLLGTVWGVMTAFGGMVVTGSALLSAVAPGISGALLTTVIGLGVAIPSAIAYNVLTSKIRRICVVLENFSQELASDLELVHVEHKPARHQGATTGIDGEELA